MRLTLLSALAIVPLLAACGDAGTPPAPTSTTPATTPAATAPAASRPVAPASFPISARPLLGTWGADAAQCSGSAATVITATSYSAGGTSCELTLTDNGDGSFATACNGQTIVLTPIFGPPGEGIRIAAGSAQSTNVFRCSR